MDKLKIDREVAHEIGTGQSAAAVAPAVVNAEGVETLYRDASRWHSQAGRDNRGAG